MIVECRSKIRNEDGKLHSVTEAAIDETWGKHGNMLTLPCSRHSAVFWLLALIISYSEIHRTYD